MISKLILLAMFWVASIIYVTFAAAPKTLTYIFLFVAINIQMLAFKMKLALITSQFDIIACQQS